MARTGLTQSDVATAYDALREAGINPSIRNIRERLGNTGSLKTIADHVRAIRTERWESPGPALPDSLLQSLVAGAGELWQELADAADAHIEANNAQCREQIAAMQVERDEATQATAAMRDALSAHQAHIVTLEKQQAQCMTERADSDSRLHAALGMQEQERSRADAAGVALDICTRERDAALRDREAAIQREQSIAGELDELTENQSLALATHDENIKTLTEENETVNRALTESTHCISHWQAESKRWEDERAGIEKETMLLRDKLQTHAKSEGDLQKQINSLTAQVSSWRTRHEASETAYAKADEKQSTLTSSLIQQIKVLIQQSERRNDNNHP